MIDRRQKKTKLAIFRALRRLMAKKSFDKITVKDLIAEADIGRSTFYNHFETKELLLDAFCVDLFNHVFEPDQSSIRDRTPMPSRTFRDQLIHILSHLGDPELHLDNLLRSTGRPLFMKYLRDTLRGIFEDTIDFSKVSAPADYVLAHTTDGFGDTLYWWILCHPELTAEEVADDYLALNVPGLFSKEKNGVQGA